MMARTSRKAVALAVAMEVCDRRIHLAVREPLADGAGSRVRTRTVVWRQQAAALHGEAARRELTQALTVLAHEEHLRGCTVNVALSRSFCVTRVVVGRASDVRHELQELEERANLYLGLGVGPKATATAVSALDARHEHALLCVANQRVLDGLLAALEQAGFRPAVVQPSLLVLSRVLGLAGRDAESPQLIVNLAEGGVELGISFRGQLLLDYRPGGGSERDVADLVAQHWSRIQRYTVRCCQQAGAHGSAALVTGGFLFGSPEAVREAQNNFQRLGSVPVEVFDPVAIDPQWDWRSSPPGPEHAAALGSCLDAVGSPAQIFGPNFMVHAAARRRERLLPLALRAGWPVAAMLLLSLLVGGVDLWKKMQCAELSAKIEELEPLGVRVTRLQTDLHRAKIKMEHLQRIRQEIANPRWQDLLASLAHSLPETLWLSRLEVGERSRITLSGVSYNEEAAFELVRWLDRAPDWENVQLEGMQSQRLPSGPAMTFDVKFNLASNIDGAKETELP
jgi:Tfp pilus assembly protein PilN